MFVPKTISPNKGVGESSSPGRIESRNTNNSCEDKIRLDQQDGPHNQQSHAMTDTFKTWNNSDQPNKEKVDKLECSSEVSQCKQRIGSRTTVHVQTPTDKSELSSPTVESEEDLDPCQRAWGPPGVRFVPWGAAGPPNRSSSAQSRLQHHDVHLISNGMATGRNTKVDDCEDSGVRWLWVKVSRRRNVILFALVLFVLLAACVSIAVVVMARKSHNVDGSQNELTLMAAPSTTCDHLFDHNQPNVITQCICAGTIEIVADDVAANYHDLVEEGFIKKLLPGFNSTMDSCNPANQALVWSASGTGTPTLSANIRQRYILALLYLIWGGEWWTASQGWFSSVDECSWLGVVCDASGSVVKVELINTGLNGNLGSEIALLSSLTSLSLGQNSLRGTLSTELVSLTNLQELSLSLNSLNGSIPREYGNMSQLTSLIISNNHLHGTLPSELGKLLELQELQATNNYIDGTIPTEFGILQNLQYIALSNNTLKGMLPTEIGLLQKARAIDLSFNNFVDGSIPSEIGQISTLTYLSLTASRIHGKLPIELFGIRGLQNLLADANNLSGTIPSQIGQLTSLSK
jgi:hypothetical protein